MYKAFVNDSSEAITLVPSKLDYSLNGEVTIVDVSESNDKGLHLLINNKSFFAQLVGIDHAEKKVDLLLNGKKTSVQLKDRFDDLLHAMGIDKVASHAVSNIKAPMPGMVLSVKATVGSSVNKGDILVVLEAMKMENAIKSPGAGVVKSILIEKGMAVDKNQVLIEFEV